MKILVAGATGKTGLKVVRELQSLGHTPIALVRESSDTDTLPPGVELRRGDLAKLPEGVCEGCDAVIFAAGSGSGTGPEMTDRIDRDGARRLIDLADAAGIKRFVMLSAMGADDPDPEAELGHYLQAKHDADEYLKASGMGYAIVRPGTLTDEEGSRDVVFDAEASRDGTSARGDVAAILAQAVEDPQWAHAVRTMQSR